VLVSRRLSHELAAALNGDSLSWLLETDPDNPGPRYFALRDLLGRPEDDPAVIAARSAVMAAGPVPAILDAQYPAGFWIKPGNYYSPPTGAPSGRSCSWPTWGPTRLTSACARLRVCAGPWHRANGAFSIKEPPVPSACLHCMSGSLLRALLRLVMPATRASRVR